MGAFCMFCGAYTGDGAGAGVKLPAGVGGVIIGVAGAALGGSNIGMPGAITRVLPEGGTGSGGVGMGAGNCARGVCCVRWCSGAAGAPS